MDKKIVRWKNFFIILFTISVVLDFLILPMGFLILGTIYRNINISQTPQSYVDDLETYFFGELTDEVELVKYQQSHLVCTLPSPYYYREIYFKVSPEYMQSVVKRREGYSRDIYCSRKHEFYLESYSDDGYILNTSKLHLSDIDEYTQTVCKNIEGGKRNYRISLFGFDQKSMSLFTFLFIFFGLPLIFLSAFFILRSYSLKNASGSLKSNKLSIDEKSRKEGKL